MWNIHGKLCLNAPPDTLYTAPLWPVCYPFSPASHWHLSSVGSVSLACCVHLSGTSNCARHIQEWIHQRRSSLGWEWGVRLHLTHDKYGYALWAWYIPETFGLLVKWNSGTEIEPTALCCEIYSCPWSFLQNQVVPLVSNHITQDNECAGCGDAALTLKWQMPWNARPLAMEGHCLRSQGENLVLLSTSQPPPQVTSTKVTLSPSIWILSGGWEVTAHHCLPTERWLGSPLNTLTVPPHCSHFNLTLAKTPLNMPFLGLGSPTALWAPGQGRCLCGLPS